MTSIFRDSQGVIMIDYLIPGSGKKSDIPDIIALMPE